MFKDHVFRQAARFFFQTTLHSVRRAGTIMAYGLKWARELKWLLGQDDPSASDGSIGATATRGGAPLQASDAARRGTGRRAEVPLHATVPDRERVPGNQRHELSSLQGPHALAPDPVAIGEELVDPEALEVPLGSSSDSSYRAQLSRSKLPQPDTTGAALLEVPEAHGGMQKVAIADTDGVLELTAQLSERPTPSDEHYDAIPPENAGLEWLTRATEAPSMGFSDELDGLDNLHVEDEFASLATSEASIEASVPSEALEEDQDMQAPEHRQDWGTPDPDAFVVTKSEKP
jgi:hypothetical protein